MKLLDNNKLNILFVFILWVLVALIISPIGNFPIGDDFAYGKPVKYYLEHGHIQITDWSSMTLVAHIYIGAFVTWLFGFSFSVLRMTTLFFGFFAIAGTYFLANEFTNNKKIALLSSVLIGFNPSFLQISYTYYTDISFYAFIIFSLLYYLKFIKKEHSKYFIAACILNVIALQIRDLAVILPAAFAIGYIYKNGIKIKKIVLALIPLLIIGIEYLIYRYWFEYIHGMTKSMDFSRNKMQTVWTSGIGYLLLIYCKNFLYSTIYIGFYLLPVIIIIYFNRFKNYSKKFKLIQLISIISLIVILPVLMKKIPKIYDSLCDILTGQHIYYNYFNSDFLYPSKDFVPVLPFWYNFLFIAIGAALGVTLWFILFDKFKRYLAEKTWKIPEKRSGMFEMLVFSIILYCIPIFTQIVVARYLFFPLATMIMLIIFNEDLRVPLQKFSKIIISAFLVFLIFDSITSEHDFMNYNRTRWKALDYLNIDMNISPKRIDGGFEYNAWYYYQYDFPKTTAKNWWWVYDDEYVISWGKIQNYNVIKEFDYTRWFPYPMNSKVFTLVRNK